MLSTAYRICRYRGYPSSASHMESEVVPCAQESKLQRSHAHAYLSLSLTHLLSLSLSLSIPLCVSALHIGRGANVCQHSAAYYKSVLTCM